MPLKLFFKSVYFNVSNLMWLLMHFSTWLIKTLKVYPTSLSNEGHWGQEEEEEWARLRFLRGMCPFVKSPSVSMTELSWGKQFPRSVFAALHWELGATRPPNTTTFTGPAPWRRCSTNTLRQTHSEVKERSKFTRTHRLTGGDRGSRSFVAVRRWEHAIVEQEINRSITQCQYKE